MQTRQSKMKLNEVRRWVDCGKTVKPRCGRLCKLYKQTICLGSTQILPSTTPGRPSILLSYSLINKQRSEGRQLKFPKQHLAANRMVSLILIVRFRVIDRLDCIQQIVLFPFGINFSLPWSVHTLLGQKHRPHVCESHSIFVSHTRVNKVVHINEALVAGIHPYALQYV
jgi:hypothetical protein